MSTNPVSPEPSFAKPCVIIGAGIAGLTAALALSHFGFAVVMLERADRLEEVGAGLQLSPNATSILQKLDVLSALLPTATVLQSVDLVAARSANTLLSLNTVPFASPTAPFLAVHRANLQAALLLKVQSLPSITLCLDAHYTGHKSNHDGVRVEYLSGSLSHSIQAHCLIGADGVHSKVRELSNSKAARYSGYVALRQTIDRSRLQCEALQAPDRVKAFLAPDAHLVTYPVSNGTKINLVLITKQAESATNASRILAEVRSNFSPELSRELMSHTDWTNWPLATWDADCDWQVDPRTMLIGDAAHAMLPFAAQGAGMAIEDGFVLAHSLYAHHSNIALAFSTYENARRKRIKRVVDRSKTNAFAYHAAGPIALARNLVFATRGQRLMQGLDWLYAHRVPGLTQ